MDENNKISETLDGYAPKLSQTEKDALWNKIDARVNNSTPVLSPYLFLFNKKMHMAPIAIALMLMLGTTGVVAASETARPGDSLFAVEQKVEGFRLAIASEEKRAELEAQFAGERLAELKSIINESVQKDDRGVSASSTSSFEADVFSDTTIVEVELNDRKTVFETEANTREEVVVEIMSRFDLSRSDVESRLDFEVEDRESRNEDTERLTISGKNEVRVSEAVAITLEYVLNGEFDDNTRNAFLVELSTLLDGVPVKMNSERIRIQDTNAWIEVRNDADDSRIEIRDDEDRIRIREKDGEIRIDTRLDIDDIFEDSRDDNGSDDNSNNSSSNSSFEAEADVFSDTTIVEVELNDRKTVFETEANTREEVVVEIMSRYGVTRADVEANLNLEVEDRESREDDTNNDSSDDSSNDDDPLLDVRGNLKLNVGND